MRVRHAPLGTGHFDPPSRPDIPTGLRQELHTAAQPPMFRRQNCEHLETTRSKNGFRPTQGSTYAKEIMQTEVEDLGA